MSSRYIDSLGQSYTVDEVRAEVKLAQIAWREALGRKNQAEVDLSEAELNFHQWRDIFSHMAIKEDAK